MQSHPQESALDGSSNPSDPSDFDDSRAGTWQERWEEPSRFEDLSALKAESLESHRLVRKMQQRCAQPSEDRTLVRKVHGLLERHTNMIDYTIHKHTGVATHFSTALARFGRHARSDFCNEIDNSFYQGIKLTKPDVTHLKDQSAKDEYGSLMKALSLRSKSVYSTSLVRLCFSQGPGKELAQLIDNWDQRAPEKRQRQFDELKLEMDGRKLHDIFSRAIPKFAATTFPSSELLREVADKYGTASDSYTEPFVAACETAAKNCGETLTQEDKELLTRHVDSYITAARASETRTDDVIHDVWTVAVAESFYHHVPKEKSKGKGQRKSNKPHSIFGPPQIPTCTDRGDAAGYLSLSHICPTQ